MAKKPTQEQRLLAALQEGIGVTPLYALYKLGIYRLSARIFDLREKGFQIRTETQGVRTSSGDIAECAVYWLEK